MGLQGAIRSLVHAAELASEEHTNTLPAKENWTTSGGYRSKAVLRGKERWLESAIASIKLIVQDRWFSSLWTLQEAFLSQWAYVISGEVEALQHDSF